MEGTGAERSARADRRIVALLTVLVVLVALLLVALTAGGLLAAREYRRMTASLQSGVEQASPGRLAAEAGQLMDEVAARQRIAAHQLERVSDATDKRLGELEARAYALRDASGGPMKKLETQIRLMQLMVDEMLTLLRHFSSSQRAVADAMRPLPTQRELAKRRAEAAEEEERATGGAAKEGEER